jgi:hypothetical protein
MYARRSRVTASLTWAAFGSAAFLAISTIYTTAGYAADTAAVSDAGQPAKEALPPIDSIGPGSDVRAFLAPGVPEELTRAALRRTWTTDPAIHDYVGLPENSQDPDRHSIDQLDARRQVSHSGDIQGSNAQ